MAGETLQFVSRAAKNLRYRKELPFPHMRQRVSAVVWTHDLLLKEIRGAMFCLLAELIYFCAEERQNKRFHKFLWSKAHWTIRNLWLQLLLAPKRSREIGLKVSLKKMASLFTKSSLKLLLKHAKLGMSKVTFMCPSDELTWVLT